jgi:hypothetical protein
MSDHDDLLREITGQIQAEPDPERAMAVADADTPHAGPRADHGGQRRARRDRRRQRPTGGFGEAGEALLEAVAALLAARMSVRSH